nr:MAG TPA: hypothetical protein [Caudoviricetes sp.]
MVQRYTLYIRYKDIFILMNVKHESFFIFCFVV